MSDEPKGDEAVVTPTTIEPSQKTERTEKDKAAFSLQKNAERLKELGGDPADVLGIKPNLKVDAQISDDEPLTYGKLREIQKQEAQKTALQLAEDIEDESERTQVVDLLQNRLRSSGNPQEDIKLARATVNSLKNTQIGEEISRKSSPNRTASGTSPGKPVENEFIPTADEATFMRPPYNLSKEKILERRKKEEANQ